MGYCLCPLHVVFARLNCMTPSLPFLSPDHPPLASRFLAKKPNVEDRGEREREWGREGERESGKTDSEEGGGGITEEEIGTEKKKEERLSVCVCVRERERERERERGGR